jgi:S1-C subfamily serine protease
MEIKCIKCGYIRNKSDFAPEYECPKCGVIYEKAEAAARRVMDFQSNNNDKDREGHLDDNVTDDGKNFKKLQTIFLGLFLLVFVFVPYVITISNQIKSISKEPNQIYRISKSKEQLDPNQIYRRSKPAVVVVKCGQSLGSGFIISPDGYIITNTHVLKNQASILIILSSGYEINASFVAKNRNDIALLQIPLSNTPYLELEQNPVTDDMVGNKVVVIGSPEGFIFSIHEGLISQIRSGPDFNWIQTSAPVNPGNSGGPLLNMYGKVIGVISRKYSGAEGLAFAIPATYLIKWLTRDSAKK